MSILNSMKNRLGFDNGDPNWDTYDDADDAYADAYDDRGRGRRESSRAGSSRTPTRRAATSASREVTSRRDEVESYDRVYENNRELAERYMPNNTIRVRSASSGVSGSAGAGYGLGEGRGRYGTDDHAPLVSYSDIRAQRADLTAQSGLSSSASPYSLRSAHAQQSRVDGPTYVTPSYSAPSYAAPSLRNDPYNAPRDAYGSFGAEPRDIMARTGSNSLRELYAERSRVEGASAFDYENPSALPPAGNLSGFGTPRESIVSRESTASRESITPRVSMRMPRKIRIIRPQAYDDVEAVAKGFRGGDLIVLALALTPPDLSRRILDFSFGVASALDGTVECLTERVFLILKGAAITEDERAQLRREGII